MVCSLSGCVSDSLWEFSAIGYAISEFRRQMNKD